MSELLNIYVAQINPTVGAIAANGELISQVYGDGVDAGADLVVTPELSVIGYPPEDLVLQPFFQREARRAVEGLARLTAGEDMPGLVIGAPWMEDGVLYNAVILCAGGSVEAVRYKQQLPNYGVFDEKRIFQAGPHPSPVQFRGVSLGLMICEDMWLPETARALSEAGADLLLVPTCSPFEVGKSSSRLEQAKDRVRECGRPLVFCNQWGGQDELIFDGGSFALQSDGSLSMRLHAWQADGRLICFDPAAGTLETGDMHDVYLPEDRLECIYQAAVLGVRDYIGKNGFPGVIIGLSGGIDSALSTAIAVDALGADRVHCVMMPSRYTSDDSLTDARACADALGVRYDIIGIEEGVAAFHHMLTPLFGDREPDTTEENIQSRLRGVLLMALSNKFGGMVLTTGNKSEVSVGYATLYGDMCGGYNALKDIYKTDVFALSHWRNAAVPHGALGPAGSVIPQTIITKPPTAELRPDQRDEDSLPPYDRLDAILQGLVDEDRAVHDLVADGHDGAEVARVEHLLYIAEYKRRQAPPGVKITSKHFGRDRRYPITNGFRSARRPE